MAFSDSSESQPGPDRNGARRLRDFRERTGKPDFRSPRNWTLARRRSLAGAKLHAAKLLFSPSSVSDYFRGKYRQGMDGYFGIKSHFFVVVFFNYHKFMTRFVSIGRLRSALVLIIDDRKVYLNNSLTILRLIFVFVRILRIIFLG